MNCISSGEINPKVMLALAKQQNALIESPPEGITLIPSTTDLADIKADITGPVDTPYEGGVFRCTLRIDEDFPRKAPKGYFLTKIFHPNVDASGDICVNTLKKDWNPAKWSLGHILGVIRCLLIIPFPESSLNEEAGRLFMDDYEEYARMAKLMTKIHALPKKKSEGEGDENENTLTKEFRDSPNYREEKKEKAGPEFKFEYAGAKHSSNLDVSMEEEDKSKEPLKNYSNMVLRDNQLNHSNTPPSDEGDKKNKISGASLFGAKPEAPKKKVKGKKKRVRRL